MRSCAQRDDKNYHKWGSKLLNILLAEDNETLGYIVTQHLKNAGHAVQLATNGTTALNLALGEPFDAILMNIEMPDMSGIDVAKTIRATESANRTTLIIALAGNASQADFETYASAGINSCLTKPVKQKTLIAALTAVIEKSSGDMSPERAAEYQSLLAEPLISAAMLGQFIAERPALRVLKTIEIFRSELEERTESLRGVIQRKDTAGLTFLAHTLIGSGHLLGARRLAGLSRLIEKDLKTGHTFELWPASELLHVMIQTAEAFGTINCETSLQRIMAHS